MGVLVLATEGDRQLDDDDLDLAVDIAHRAALAVSNARAFQQEHEIAESLQRALLPTTVSTVSGLELAVRYEPPPTAPPPVGTGTTSWPSTTGRRASSWATWWATTSPPRRRWASCAAPIRIYAWEEHARPAAALARVDRLFDKLGLAYATSMFGVLDRNTATFRWSNAGHPPPLLLREGKATFLVKGSGVLLGVTGGAGMEEATTGLQEGDDLVLFTDGLVERRDEPLEARLAAAAERSDAKRAEVLCEALLEAWCRQVPPERTTWRSSWPGCGPTTRRRACTVCPSSSAPRARR